MKCPFCEKEEDKVLESRDTDEGKGIRRRRECISCGQRYTTFERIEERPLMVIKKDGRREQFSREKLRKGIRNACEKRPVSTQHIDALIFEIERNIHKEEGREVASLAIGEMVMEKLHEIDKVAYIRFASVYRNFEHVSEFAKAIREMAR